MSDREFLYKTVYQCQRCRPVVQNTGSDTWRGRSSGGQCGSGCEAPSGKTSGMEAKGEAPEDEDIFINVNFLNTFFGVSCI